MGGTSVLDQNKPAKKEKEKKSVVDNSTKSASPADNSVLANTKPVTFYKKAWFWIIIAVLVLGGAGVGIFFGVRSAIIADQIKKFDNNVEEAYKVAEEFDDKFNSAWNKSGLKGYYIDTNERSVSLRNKCLEKSNIKGEVYENIYKYHARTGKSVSDELGSGKVADMSKEFGDAIDNLKKAKDNISECETMLDETVKSDVEVEFGEFYAKEYGAHIKLYDAYLPIKVTNKSGQTMSFRVVVTAYDSDGNKITYESAYASNLSDGESKEGKIFTYETTSVNEKLLAGNVKYEITEVDEY